MVTRLVIARVALNRSIADLYERLDKPKAARYYKNIEPEPWIDWERVAPAQTPLYRAIFEGDGGESWYGFMLPDTQSVVSRHDDDEKGYEKTLEQQESGNEAGKKADSIGGE